MKTLTENQWTRREFTVHSAFAMLSGVAITMTGCGDDSGPSTPTTPSAPAPAPPVATDVSGAVGTNHGHTAVVTAAMLTAGNDLNIDITGTANHPHSVSLSGAELGQIAGGTRVAKTSTDNTGHAHTVTFN